MKEHLSLHDALVLKVNVFTIRCGLLSDILLHFSSVCHFHSHFKLVQYIIEVNMIWFDLYLSQ
jgi:hypothetical protein